MNEHGVVVKCPNCGWLQVTFADKRVNCQRDSCRKSYEVRGRIVPIQPGAPLNNGPWTPGFVKASEMVKQ